MDSGIMLYAPTYRGPIENAVPVAGFDIPNALNALSKRFRKKFVCLFRRHSYFIKETNIDDNSVIDVSVYPDMQELLCAADVLITDYSSSMWDFSLTYKPCFLYVPDLENYKAERDFYVPPEKWPFPLAQTNAGIEKNILAFDNEKYREDVKRHHAEFVSYDSGSAREAVADLVLNRQ
jgi:CDP-glycerol glycerophosphotransferase